MKSVPPVPEPADRRTPDLAPRSGVGQEPAGGRLMQVRQGTDARRAWGDILDRSDAY